MKRFFYIIVVLLVCSQYGMGQTIDFPATEYSQDPKANFRLYKTKNMYNFIKLDTRTGQMELVQWSVKGNRMSYKLSNKILVSSPEEQIPGRFTLYATTNIYQFVLLDQIDGRTWQVQWGIEKDHRWISRIHFNEEIEPVEPVETECGLKLQPQELEKTFIGNYDIRPVDEEYKLQVTMQMASVQEQYRNQLLGKSPINVAYMTVMKKLMLSPYKLDWEYVETLTKFLASLLETDCTINKENLEKQLEGKTEYKDVINVFEMFQ